MVAQPLRAAGAALLLDRLEHVRHVARVVAAGRHQVRAFEVGVALEFAAESEERGAEPELRALRDDLSPAAADDRPEHGAGDLADLVFRRLARLCGAVTQDDVTQFVRHDPRDFAFGVRGFDHAAIDEHRPAGQRERVDFTDVDDFEGVAELGMTKVGRNHVDQPASDALDVGGDLLVGHHRQRPPRFGRGLLAELDILSG